jgi:hypothetical protein
MLTRRTLPKSITAIMFCNSFNRIIKPKELPSRLSRLSFGVSFNQPFEIDTLPPISTQQDRDFDQIIQPSVLPSYLFPRIHNYKLQHFYQKLECIILTKYLINLTLRK